MDTPTDNNSTRGGTGEGVPNKKNTSSDKKIEQSKDKEDCSEIVSDILGRLDISNNDELLFRDPPPRKECPICMLPMPHANGLCGVHHAYNPCCGKLLCRGCSNEMMQGNMKLCCAFCRTPLPRSHKEYIKRLKKRVKLKDAEAFFSLGCFYYHGQRGLSQDRNKGLELWNQAAELGSISAHYNISTAYFSGDGVEQDEKKANYHYKMAAIGGHEEARHNLGCMEERNGNRRRAMKHFMIAASAGDELSLTAVGKGFRYGCVTKDEYTSTLRAYQSSCDDMKSEQRAKATYKRVTVKSTL